MGYNFPFASAVGEEFTDSASGMTYVWNGTGWLVKAGDAAPAPIDAYTKAESDANFVNVPGDTMTGMLSIAQPNEAWLELNGGTNAAIAGNIGGNGRFMIHLARNPTGNFQLHRMLDDGTTFGAMETDRLTGRTQFFGDTVVTKGDGSLAVDGTPSHASMGINSGIGYQSQILGSKNNVMRWNLYLGNAEAETGGNRGSRFSLGAYDDNGVGLCTPLSILRTGEVYLDGPTDSYLAFARASAGVAYAIAGSVNWYFGSNPTITTGQYMTPGGGSWVALSDARLAWKAGGAPVTDALSKLSGFQLYSGMTPSGQVEMFVKAQELAATLPELVVEGSGPDARTAGYTPKADGPDPNLWGVSYDRAGVVALQMIKELLARIEALEVATPQAQKKR